MIDWQWEALDWQLADLLAEYEQTDAPLLKQSVRMLSHQVRAGDTCLYLPAFAGQTLEEHGPLPELEDWVTRLAACESVGGDHKPLVLDRGETGSERLYFQRYWQYEQTLAARLTGLAKARPEMPPEPWLDERLGKLPLAKRQAQAVRRAFSHGLCVISGGPGTGKTTTISALVMLLKAWRPEMRISMAAPTGKAAARMQESVRGAAEFLGLPDKDCASLSQEAMTLHRLLGFQYGKVGFRHHATNPLSADVIIVDEASMIDLALMSKLLEAVRPDARLVLLGDKDQLASVEAGAVMATLCDQNASNALSNNVVALEKVHRYGRDSGISLLAQAVNSGDTEKVLDVLRSDRYDDAQLLDVDNERWRERLHDRVLRRMNVGALGALHDFQLLCALREGPRGVVGMNRQIENALVGEGRIPGYADWYAGRPVMITRNSPVLRLYNGDIGLAVRSGGSLRVRFEGADGPLEYSTARLTAHETAWALTVHKSQGSEFNEVMLMLPDDAGPLMTRELIYTAITRAKDSICIVGSADVLVKATSTMTSRRSGLSYRLKTQ